MRFFTFLLAASIFIFSGHALAHPLTFTATELVLRADGTFQVDMVCDLDALALGAAQDTDDAELVATLRSLSTVEFDDRVQRLRRLFERRVRIRFDGQATSFAVAFPDYGTPKTESAERPTVLGLIARLTGLIPSEATNVEFFASRSFSEVHLSVIDERSGVANLAVLERGARSDPFDLTGTTPNSRRAEVAYQYLRLGFTHIVPRGADHVLFVLGLFLLSTRLKPLVWQITSFTVAHALTLALATLGFVTFPSRTVETLIAVSIVYVAIENLLTKRLTRWRPIVVFAFGLLHGLGFAGVLSDLGLPQDDRVLILAVFNVGIEVGQLATLGAAFLVIGWWRDQWWYRSRVVIPASILIAISGGILTVQRLSTP